jgi:DNA-3-methyladenine glycosylase
MADKNLTSGPGKLTIALGIDRGFNGEHLAGDRIWVEEYKNIKKAQIFSGPRVGIDYAEEFVDVPWRFWVRDSPFVSKTPVRSPRDPNSGLRSI